jgi:putative ABC transport system ATP-binding protein
MKLAVRENAPQTRGNEAGKDNNCAEGNPLIQLQKVEKVYSTGVVNFCALKEIDLCIRARENIAILGPSGSGKSTLMQIIGCLSTPTSGSYLLDGKEVSTLTRNELASIRNRKIGFVFQSFNLLPQLTIVENVALPLVYRGTGSEERMELARDFLNQLGLSQHLKHRANELSGGQQQRVAIARALVTNPDIILADEPTGNLDSKAGGEVIALLGDLVNRGKTVVVITHDEKLAQKAEKIVYLQDGMIQRIVKVSS